MQSVFRRQRAGASVGRSARAAPHRFACGQDAAPIPAADSGHHLLFLKHSQFHPLFSSISFSGCNNLSELKKFMNLLYAKKKATFIFAKNQKKNRKMYYKIIAVLLIASMVIGCSGESDKKKEEQKKPMIKLPEKPKAKTAPATMSAPDLGKKAKPGFKTKFERGQKRRETIKDKFDDSGNLIERTDKMFNKFGEVVKKNRYTYKYDDAGRRIEQWYYATTDNGEPIMSNVNYIKYNDKGWKIENIFISYDAEGKETRWVKNEFKHNSDGRIIEDITYDKQGHKQLKVNYNIVNDMLVSENFTKYDENGEPVTKTTISYDKTGTVIDTKEEKLK
jgi:hypothetical protein